MDLSFQEKSILGSLIITTILFGAYFIEAFGILFGNADETGAGLPFMLIGIVIAVIVVEVVYQAIIALTTRKEAADERDKLISARATQIAYYILAAGCITAVGHLLISAYISAAAGAVGLRPTIVAANLIVFSFILAEVVGFSLQLYYYRKGV